jgi:flagellar hook-associated protein 1 FlgK
VKIDTVTDPSGAVNISVAGASIVSGKQVLDTLQVYDAGGGQMLVRTQTGGTPLTLTGGRTAGTITARDGGLATLRNNLDLLAGQLITEVNAIHAGGFSLTGSTGENFFAGTNAATIQVNSNLLGDPSLIQAAGTAGASGDNQTALALAQLGNQKIIGLSNQTFNQNYGQTVAAFGQSLSSVNGQAATQQVVETMLRGQRDAISGVSLDEEMTDLMKFQKAYQASARLITTVDDMLDTVLNMKR